MTDKNTIIYRAAPNKSINSKNKNKIDDAVYVKIQRPWYTKIIIFLLLAILIYLFFNIFTPLLDFSIYIQWWNRNGGKKYNKIFSITQMAYYYNFLLYYYIGNLLGSGFRVFQSKSQVAFIMSMITTFGTFDPGSETDPSRFLLPRQICETIIPGSDEDANQYPDNIPDWKDQLTKWGYPDIKDVGGNVPSILSKLDSNKWSAEGNGNFFYHQYNMPITSPFIVSFFAGTPSDPIIKWSPDAFPIALGISPIVGGSSTPLGGWWGYAVYALQSEKDTTFSNMVEYLYTLETGQLQPSKPQKCDKSSIGPIAGGVVTTAATFAMAGSAGGPPGAIAGAIFGAIFGGFTSAGKQNCPGGLKT